MKNIITGSVFAAVGLLFSIAAYAQQPVDAKTNTGNKKDSRENVAVKNDVKPVTLPEAAVSHAIAAPQTLNTGIPDMPLPKPILPNMPADVHSKTAVMPENKKPAPVIIDAQKKQ